jgi:hypothetical protein
MSLSKFNQLNFTSVIASVLFFMWNWTKILLLNLWIYVNTINFFLFPMSSKMLKEKKLYVRTVLLPKTIRLPVICLLQYPVTHTCS